MQTEFQNENCTCWNNTAIYAKKTYHSLPKMAACIALPSAGLSSSVPLTAVLEPVADLSGCETSRCG